GRPTSTDRPTGRYRARTPRGYSRQSSLSSRTAGRACAEQGRCGSPFFFMNLCNVIELMPSTLHSHEPTGWSLAQTMERFSARPKTEVEKMKFMNVTPKVFGTVSPQRRSLGVKTKQNSRRSGSKPQKQQERENGVTRRRFLGVIGGVTAVGMAAGSIPLEPLLEEKHSVAEAAIADFQPAVRTAASMQYRKTVAQD